MRLQPHSPVEGLLLTLSVPSEISFPYGSQPAWYVVGPIFLVFVPFYFATRRKIPMSSLAVGVGLATLGLSVHFDLELEYIMVALVLLAIPAAVAGHRFMEQGWRKNATVAMLYILIGWHAFNSTAVVEGIFSSPHRYLLGVERDEQYLERAVEYYPIAKNINTALPADVNMMGLGRLGSLYIERKIVLADEETSKMIIELLSEAESAGEGVAWLRWEGYTHVLINTAKSDSDSSAVPSDEGDPGPLQKAADNLHHLKLLHDGKIYLFSLR
jgi:hypothetical protein